MKELCVLNLVQKEGTNNIITPLLIFEPQAKNDIKDIMKDVVIKMDNYGISVEKSMRSKIFSLFRTCEQISNMTNRKIYINEQVSFSVTEIYQIESNTSEMNAVTNLLESFKKNIR